MSMTKLLRVTEILRKELSIEFSTIQLIIFLRVAEADAHNEKAELAEIARKHDFTTASASRNLYALLKHDRKRRPGYDLVQQGFDPADRRRRPLELSAKGKRVYKKLAKIFEG